MVRESRQASAFPGNREDSYRAGITARILGGTRDLTMRVCARLRIKRGKPAVRSHKYWMKTPSKAGYALPVLALAGLLGAGLAARTLRAADPPPPPSDPPSSTQAAIVPRVKPGEQSAAPLPKANIRVDTNVVLIPVTVTDPLNRFVTGLDQDVFEVSEDK